MSVISEAGKLSTFKKILDTAIGIGSDVKNEYKQNKNTIRRNSMNSLNRSSIMRASKDLVMTFPVLCTDTVQVSTASMITKAIERNCVTTLQLLFASANLSGENGLDVLAKWHTNFDNDMDIDEYMDAMDALATTSKYVYQNKDMMKAKFNDIRESMIKECKENNQYFPESSFSESSISCYLVEDSRSKELSIIKEGQYNNFYLDDDYVYDTLDQQPKSVNQADIDYKYQNYKLDREKYDNEKQRQGAQDIYRADKDKKDYEQREKQRKAQQRNFDRQFNQRADEINRQQQNFEKQFNQRQDQINVDQDQKQQQIDLQYDKFKYDRDQDERVFNQNQEKINFDQRMRAVSSRRELFQKQLLDSDVKKCNELVPSMMIINYLAPDPTGNSPTSIEREFIAGVKARLISCSSNEIIDRIRSIQKNKPNRLNLIRATTKEISFCKDFIAGIDQAKIDAKRNSKLSKNSAIWRSLQARSTKSGINRLKKNRANDAGAITTLVVSDEEVNYLIKEDGIDLNNPMTAKSIMEAYNLMGFVIVDEQTEVAKFLFDGEKYFQEFAFNTLERETGDNSYKKVVNLLSRNIK